MKVHEYLMAHDVKPSLQRMAVMEYLMAHRTHPTVDVIYQGLSKKIPTLSRTTVYNTLRLLVEKGAAQMLTIDERFACFDADTSLHSHFFCKKCGKVYDVPYRGLESENGTYNIEGHEATEIHQYYRGICKECKSKEN